MIAILVLLVACCVVACNPKNETVVNATLLEKGFYSIKDYKTVTMRNTVDPLAEVIIASSVHEHS